MKNPGFLIKIKKPTNIIVKLRSIIFDDYYKKSQRKKGERFSEPPSLNICIYKIIDKNEFELVHEDGEYMAIP